jgi:hypothetical protein
MPGNPLLLGDAPADDLTNPLGIVRPTPADAWDYNAQAYGGYVASSQADAVTRGLVDPETGWPTQAGIVQAARSYANALLFGSRAPVAVDGSLLGSSLSARPNPLFYPPDKPPRPFEADYPAGAPTDAAGRLTADIEGRPLGGQFIAGRRMAGGNDEAIPPTQYDALATASIGADVTPVAPRVIRGDSGRFVTTRVPVEDLRPGDAGYDPYATGGYVRKYQILVNRALPPGSQQVATAHELGHMVDELSGQIPTQGLSGELAPLYSTLTTGQERTTGLTRPTDLGYSRSEAPREQIAAAVQAYLTNPNYIKTVAPKTAAAIRAAVNGNPRLRDVIQFNGLAGIAATGNLPGNQQGQQ